MSKQNALNKIFNRLNNVERAIGNLKTDVEELRECLAKGYYDPSKKEPEQKPKPQTTVKVWDKPESTYPPFRVWQYGFTGTPDIDRVIKETLEQGAMVVKIKCNAEFTFDKSIASGGTIWQKDIKISNWGWEYKEKYLANYYPDTQTSDSVIESAITEYLKKRRKPEFKVGDVVVYQNEICQITHIDPYQKSARQMAIANKTNKDYWVTMEDADIRPATSDEEDEFYTGEIGGIRVRAYRYNNGIISLYYVGDIVHNFSPNETLIAEDICAKFNTPIKTLAADEVMKQPEIKGGDAS